MPRGSTELTKYRKLLIFDWAHSNAPVTVRQIFYRLSTQDAVPKTENGYKTVVRLCSQMRRDGEIPFPISPITPVGSGGRGRTTLYLMR